MDEMFAPPLATQKKRLRGSDGGGGAVSGFATSLGQRVAASPFSSSHSVPRASTSAASWGVAQLSDSEGDGEEPALDNSSLASSGQADAARDMWNTPSAVAPPPPKRPHLDEATSGRFASMRIDSQAGHRPIRQSAGSLASDYSRSSSRRRGVGGAFGQTHLSQSLSSALGSSLDQSSFGASLPAPPSSPTKTSAQLASLVSPVSGAPPASPEYGPTLYTAPPVSPVRASSAKDGEAWLATTFETRDGDIEDLDMRLRRGPTSYEIEPDRIVVNSLDDTSSSEGEDNDVGSSARTPEYPFSSDHHQPDATEPAAGDFVVNKELMDKLEAHRRAVLTGTSDRDNEQSARDAKSASSSGRHRRGGRRSGGGLSGLGSLLSSRRRSAQSSQASSPGYTTPITNEEANGALVLWRDPEEVRKATSASLASLLGARPVNSMGGGIHTPSSLRQESGSTSLWPIPAANGHDATSHDSNGIDMTPFSFGSDNTSPLAAQQSLLSSSYFGEPRSTAWAMQREALHSQQQPQHFAVAQSAPASAPAPMWAPPSAAATHLSSEPDPSSHFGMADEMELDG